mmetsp:Transcript_141104/g.245707  ORF Transcript_141104/g.245707 Transcript_141104/m.245707 type:complete len:80 (-) Transcript_141104:477-716(-)
MWIKWRADWRQEYCNNLQWDNYQLKKDPMVRPILVLERIVVPHTQWVLEETHALRPQDKQAQLSGNSLPLRKAPEGLSR